MMPTLLSLLRKLAVMLVIAWLPLTALAGTYAISISAVPPSGSLIGVGQVITYTITVSNSGTTDQTGFNGFIRMFDTAPAQTLFQFAPGVPNGVLAQPGSGSFWNCNIVPNGASNQFLCYAGSGPDPFVDSFAGGNSVVFRVNALVTAGATPGSVKSNTASFDTDLDGNGIDEVFIQTTSVVHTVGNTLTYDGNGNTGGSVPLDFAAYGAGTQAPVKANTGSLVRTGFTFAGWNSLADGTGISYPATGAITLTMGLVNLTLFARWTTPCTFDVDGNNNIDALSDGLMMIRAMFGLTGNAVTGGAMGGGATRTDWTVIRSFVNGNCGTSFGP